ncbi:SMC5-SMC6 complex localization factor protein 1 [Fundulus heteroclitus]|uniref:SMC5-SMC6 complex localization factor protein 1 n=1 Tax=Fundulus heteroclitus TaxID=8078 RepID=UPI00165B37B7|nr:SMC5-SMC6 complex localization factor protein 1 [Fundulus heteroclitus]XP_021171455.2 SMC5-SMC6 complex localization factor protein 1 [Fundulus heteroclitus]
MAIQPVQQMESCKRVFQISGIKVRDKKRVLIKGIYQLGGKYIGGSAYKHCTTHLIIPQVLPSEKFFAACAAGKWVVTPKYVLESMKNGSWLPEGAYEVAICTSSSAAFYPVRQWREKVSRGRVAGAFQDWRVLLMVQEPGRRAMFKRLLKAGKAEVYDCPPVYTSITHVVAKPVTEKSKSFNAPCYPVSHIVQHLFGSNHVDMNFNKTEDHPSETKAARLDCFSNLEADLRGFAVKKEERPRLWFYEFLSCGDPRRPHTQAIVEDITNVASMIECGLFSEALDSIRSSVLPGLLPPATYLISLLEYAQQGNASPLFLRDLRQVMENLLFSNPPWLASTAGRRFYCQLLQCPQCKMGLWPLLETAVRYCLTGSGTCHPHPGPAVPGLLHFYADILAFCLKFLKAELHSITGGDSVPPQQAQAPSAPTCNFLLYRTFWTVWERTTLLSPTVKKLLQLVTEAAVVDFAEGAEKRDLYLADTLLDLLSVLVEFWCQRHFKLNQSRVEKGLKDLSEHLAVVSQDLSPDVLVELVCKVRSSRLRLVVADAIFRNLCCRSGVTVGDDPFSLSKMVQSYLPALGTLAQSPSIASYKTGQPSHSCRSQGTSRAESQSVTATSPERENGPRGLSRVNAAGETLLHRACKRNQVETVLQILALPGTDVNVKDHAGWTPLHEACNHGSTESVRALLHHRPAPVLTDQVGGVSPLHDALLNGHLDIAKMLLEHGGSVLLQQTDGDGQAPLDMVSAPSQREELLRSAQVGDSARTNKDKTQVFNLPLLEAGSYLLGHLIFSYLLDRGLPGLMQLGDRPHALVCELVGALDQHGLQKVTVDWTDQRAVRLAGDVETLLKLSRGLHKEQVSLAVKECRGEKTVFLMETLESLSSRGKALLADL